MDKKTKGIILKLTDYKDADKLASIFTFDYGKITAKFVGVKKEKAKFKSVAVPFNFAEFVLTSTGNNNIVTSADSVDSFSKITENYNKLMCAYCVVDTINSIVMPDKKEEDLFLLTLQALKNIETQNEHLALIKFLLDFISFEGFELDLGLKGFVYLDKNLGNFVNKTSQFENLTQIDKKVYSLLCGVNKNEVVDFNLTTAKQVIRLLHNIIYIDFGVDVKSFEFV